MYSRSRRLAGPLACAGVFGALFCAGAAHAQLQVTVVPKVTTTGALYNYAYSITNFTATDLAIINLNGLPLTDGALTNLFAPAGFQISPYDSGVGIESFLADTDAFTPGSTITDFSFSSIYSPETISFDAEDNNGVMSTGTTLGPTGAPLPEASTSISLGVGLLVLGFAAVQRRRSALRSAAIRNA